MHIHAAVLSGLFQGHLGESTGLAVFGFAHQITEQGGTNAVIPISHHIEAVFRCRIPEVISQQGVHDDTSKR